MNRNLYPTKFSLKHFYDLPEKIPSMENKTNIYWVSIIFKTVLDIYYFLT